MSEINWNSNAFKDISPNKIEVIKNIAKELSGLTPEASLAYFASINNRLKSENVSFTPSERDLIISVLMENMSAVDKNKLSLIRNLIK